MTAPRVVALIPSYQPDEAQLAGLVEGLGKAEVEPVVIANSAVAAETCRSRGFVHLEPGANIGFGPSVDWAIQQVGRWDWVLLANDDLTVDAALLGSAIRSSLDEKGPAIVHLDDEPARPIPGVADVLMNVSLLGRLAERIKADAGAGPGTYRSFSCVLISRAAWEATGGFDLRLPFTYEDADFVRRLIAANGRALHRTGTGVHHERSKTASRSVRLVLPVSTWSALTYLRRWSRVGSPVIRALLVFALVLRVPLVPFGSAQRRAHLDGIGRTVRAMFSRQPPSMPPYEPGG